MGAQRLLFELLFLYPGRAPASSNAVHHEPWNKGKIVGQKAPF